MAVVNNVMNTCFPYTQLSCAQLHGILRARDDPISLHRLHFAIRYVIRCAFSITNTRILGHVPQEKLNILPTIRYFSLGAL